LAHCLFGAHPLTGPIGIVDLPRKILETCLVLSRKKEHVSVFMVFKLKWKPRTSQKIEVLACHFLCGKPGEVSFEAAVPNNVRYIVHSVPIVTRAFDGSIFAQDEIDFPLAQLGHKRRLESQTIEAK
jgi:hypothetical protein